MASVEAGESITDEAYWREFWKSYKPDVIPEDFYCEDLMQRLRPYLEGMPEDKTCIEIGGFPGRNMVFISKYHGFRCSLIDLVVEPDVICQLEEENGMEAGSITPIQGDLLTYEDAALEGSFDMVMSGGFIEHFNDPKKILEKHLYFLKPGGVLLVTLPNLRGLTGLPLRLFGQDEFASHNLNTMDTDYLARITQELSVSKFECFDYYEDSAIFLPSDRKFKTGWRKAAFLPVRALSKVLERVKVPHPAFSPQICLLARKPL